MRTDPALESVPSQLLLQIARSAISNVLGQAVALPEPAG